MVTVLNSRRGPVVEEVVPGVKLDKFGFGGIDLDWALTQLRREAPVAWYEPGRFWSVVRHADVQSVSLRPRVFSSAKGVLMGDQFDESRLSRRGGVEGENLIELDPPRHRELRRVLGQSFTPAAISQMEDRIREIVQEVVSSLDASRPVDLVASFAVPIPLRVIAELLGANADDWALFKLWTDAMIARLQPDISQERADEAVAELAEMNTYLAQLQAKKREAPGDDLVSIMIQSAAGDDALSAATVHTMCVALLIAGNETTRSLIAGGARLLADHPEQRARLAEDPTGLPATVEECLRCVTPITSFVRTATEDAMVGDQLISAGDCVAMFYRSANRDDAVWADPTAFDTLRDPGKAHLAFGWGQHLCIGAPLARLEVRLAFEELLRRYPDYRVLDGVGDLLTPLLCTTTALPVALR